MTGEGTDDKQKIAYYMNELLFYVQNAKNTQTKQDVVKMCVDFYTDQEIENAKTYLWSKCEVYSNEKLQRRKSPDKVVKNVSDIVEFMYNLDWKQCPVRFAAIDATRVPSMVCTIVNSDEKSNNDLCMTNFLREMNDMKRQIEFLTKTIQTLATVQISNDIGSKSLSNGIQSTEHTPKHSKQTDTGNAYTDTNKQPWNLVARRKKKVMIGNNDADNDLKVATVTYRRELHITRLTLDTTADTLKAYIIKKGVTVSLCEELKPPERITSQITYKSFHVTLESTDKGKVDRLLDASEWPFGIAVRRFWVKRNDDGRT